MRLFRNLLRWWSELDTKPTGFRIEKLSILFSGILACVSTVLAILTFNQQQKIEGMSNLLQKQDSTIHLLATLSKDNKDLINQNTTMISRLESTQQIVLDQLNAIKSQTTSEQYSTRPILGLDGAITMSRDNNDILKYFIKINYKNYGFRPAIKIKTSVEWVYFNSNNQVARYLETSLSEYEGSIHSNQSMELRTFIKFASDEELKRFQTVYLVVTFHFYDQLTKFTEKIISYNKQDPEESDTTNPILLKLVRVSPYELNALELYMEKEK